MTDVLLENGDLVLDAAGAPVRIGGARAALQQACLRLMVRRGALAHDPTFGSRLHALGVSGGAAARDSAALAAVREALAPMSTVRVQDAHCLWDAASARMSVQVRLQFANETHALEVTL